MTKPKTAAKNAPAKKLAAKAQSLAQTQARDASADSPSISAQIALLERGESMSRVRQVDPSMSIAVALKTLSVLREQLRNNLQPAVARAKVITAGTYTVETSEFMTPPGKLFAVAVVTRIA